MNLIAVNWDKSSQTLNYIAARNRVEPIGAHLAAMIDFLVRNEQVSISDISVIGFSLGAHIAGIGWFKRQIHLRNKRLLILVTFSAGKHVQSGKLPKIVGLDPAGPLFSLKKPHERLDRLDAKYVFRHISQMKC